MRTIHEKLPEDEQKGMVKYSLPSVATPKDSYKETEQTKAINFLRSLEHELDAPPKAPTYYKVWIAVLKDHLRLFLPPGSAILALVDELPLTIEESSTSLQECEIGVFRDLIRKAIGYIECHGVYNKPKDHATRLEIGWFQNLLKQIHSATDAINRIAKVLPYILSITGIHTTNSRPPSLKADQSITTPTVHREDSTRNIKKLNYSQDNNTIKNNNTIKERK